MIAEEPSSPITFQTDDPEYFVEHIAPVASNVTIQPWGGIPFRSRVQLTRLPRLGLFTVAMSSARVVDTEPIGYCSITVPLDAPFQTMRHGRVEDFPLGSAYVAHWNDPFDLRVGGDTTMLVANIDTPLLYDYACKLQGGEAATALRFRPRLSLATPCGASFGRYLSFVWGELTRERGLLSPLVITELENALVALFLSAVMDEPDAAARPGKAMHGSPGYLRRAEDYLLAHLAEPVSMADLAGVAGIGARTLSKAFRQRYGVGPLGFLQARRLDAAHRALLAADPHSTTVTDVALCFGFSHLGRFAADYRQTFQEAPSETLRR